MKQQVGSPAVPHDMLCSSSCRSLSMSMTLYAATSWGSTSEQVSNAVCEGVLKLCSRPSSRAASSWSCVSSSSVPVMLCEKQGLYCLVVALLASEVWRLGVQMLLSVLFSVSVKMTLRRAGGAACTKSSSRSVVSIMWHLRSPHAQVQQIRCCCCSLVLEQRGEHRGECNCKQAQRHL